MATSSFNIKDLMVHLVNIAMEAKQTLQPGEVLSESLQELEELADGVCVSSTRIGNLIYGLKQIQNPTSAQTSEIYSQVRELRSERTVMLQKLLKNKLLPSWIKYEITTNLPRLICLEDPDYYHI